MEPDWLIDARRNGLVQSESKVNIEMLSIPYVSNSLLKAPKPAPELKTKAKKKKQPRLKTDLKEDQFQTIVIELLHLHGWRVAHFRKVRIQRKDGSVYWQTPVAADGKGFLDLEAIRGRRLLKIELKVNSSLSAEQKQWIKCYEEAGIECYVWKPKDWETIKSIVE